MDSSAMALMDWRSIMNVAHSGTNSPYSLCIRSTEADRGDECKLFQQPNKRLSCAIDAPQFSPKD
ncbi:hypothetical protein FVEG_14807 [Fusarium verticillioides 7600]|uniref:Uncharacterized protein n=1 Tax=Gibberella moniliformis (strain M3125 / FGSC 7600) TaxID=334819 RepID=W7LEK5_GIBM7|nr:hypothetical protein FVEG_14807 [Fusarium verticillioides 7600]EWG37878.1 hypothetical protein FVEG_14807 [Fusarium verticillioides 7600]